MMELEQKVFIHFLRGKGLGLVSINKLEQLRKYIFDRDIERTQIKQVSNPKGNFVGINKTFSFNKLEKKVCCCHFLKGLKINEAMSKPNDANKDKRFWDKETYFYFLFLV